MGTKLEQIYDQVEVVMKRRFRTEGACKKLLEKKRWPSQNGIVCPRCHSWRKGWRRLTTRDLFECKWCGTQFSATTRSIFHKTHLPFRTWFRLILLMWRCDTEEVKLSLRQAQRILGIGSYQTIWTMAHKIHNAWFGKRKPWDFRFLKGIVDTANNYMEDD